MSPPPVKSQIKQQPHALGSYFPFSHLHLAPTELLRFSLGSGSQHSMFAAKGTGIAHSSGKQGWITAPITTGASSSFFIPQQLFQGQALTLCRSQWHREMLSVTGEAGSENERLWAASRASRALSGSVWMMFLCLARILTQIRAGAGWGLCGCLARAFPATVYGARAQLQK